MRPDWHEYFLGLAFVISARSRDVETKHGSVITDFNNLIIGTGYNSNIKGINDSIIPNTRPSKYPFMIHAEMNAILNCKVLPRECGGGKLYVTGKCCNNCFQACIQAGIKEFYMAKRRGSALESEESDQVFNTICEQAGVIVKYVDINLTWIKEVIKFF